MPGEIEIRPIVNPLDLPPPERKLIFNVVCVPRVMRQLTGIMTVKVHLLFLHPERLKPPKTFLFPVLEPLLVGARRDEELHLHLLEFPRPEEEILRVDLVPERLPYLGDAERGALARRGLHVQKIYEYPLRRLRAEVHYGGGILQGADKRLKHQVEPPRIREFPVRLAA